MNDKELIEEIGVLIPMEKGDFNQTYIDEILAREIISIVRKADHKAVREAAESNEALDNAGERIDCEWNCAIDVALTAIDNVLGDK